MKLVVGLGNPGRRYEATRHNVGYAVLAELARKFGVTPPKALYQPEPKFSQLARKQKLSGVATVQLIVDTQGNPANVHIAKSIADTVGKNKKKQAAALSLDQAALDAVKQYKFAPATWHGKPVAVYLNVEVNFQIF